MNICNCYDPVNMKCNGTRERDYCLCKGNEKDCDFYEEKRSKDNLTTLITNRDWLAGLSDEDLARWFLNDYNIKFSVDGYVITAKVGVNELNLEIGSNKYDSILNWLKSPKPDYMN